MSRLFALNRFDKFFEDSFAPLFKRFDDIWKDWDLSMEAFDKLQPKGSFPKVNVIEKEGSYDVEIAVAGFDKDDVSLELKDNALMIKADKHVETPCEDEEECSKYLTREIAHRSFRRTVVFPSEVNTEDISAKYENGIITCCIGKLEEDKPTNIKIDIE
jgi:HSP20 family protein